MPTRLPAAILLLAMPAAAQLTHVIPNGFATTDGNGGNFFPWSSTSNLWGGLRTVGLYDSTNFTNANIGYPILISRLRWRADAGASAWTGGSFTSATVQMATAAVDAMSPNATAFGPNFGNDLTVVFTGPVTIAAGSTSNPGPWVVDVPLTTPFLYDPALGDLAIDVDISNANGTNWSGGTTPYLDVDSGPTTLASRVFASASYPAVYATGTPHGIICEVTYLPAQGAAIATSYGGGCIAAAASFYETFAPNTFDLANSALQMIPANNGYVVVPAGMNFRPPTTPSLALGNDAVSAVQSLPFPFTWPGGSTTGVVVSSNGFVWLQANSSPGCCIGNAPQLLGMGPRLAPLWADLDPGSAGTVHFEVDGVSGTAWITWLNVQETGQTATCSFQLALHRDGRVEFFYQACSLVQHTALVGWSPGGNARDPGPVDLSTQTVITGPDTWPLALAASARPVLGTTIALATTRVPAVSQLGVVDLGFQKFVPGLPLAQLGAPDCFQHAGLQVTMVFVPSAGTGSVSVGVPALQALAGLHVYSQSLALAPGINPLGILTSNGLDLLLNPQ